MTLYKAGWIGVAIEILILLVWLYDIYFSKKGTDAAGKGLAMLYILALAAYILISVILMLVNNRYCTTAVLILAAIPVLVVIYGLIRYYT